MRIRLWQSQGVENFSLATGTALLFVAGIGPFLGWALAHEEWQILAALMLAATIPVVIRWPIISTFGLYAFLVPFDSVASLGAGGTLTKLVGMGAIAVMFGTAFVDRRLIRPPTTAIYWAVFLLWAVLSAAWAIDPWLVVTSITPMSLLLLYFVAVSIRVSRKELVWVVGLWVLGAAIAAAMSVFYGVESAYESSERGGARQALTLGQAAASLNGFAASLIGPLAMAMGGFLALRSWTGRLVSLGAIGAIVAAIYLTMSRGAVLGIGVMVAVVAYRFRLRAQILVLGCLLLGVAALMPSVFIDRIAAIGNKDSTGTGRTGIWAVGIDALEEHGLVGGGFRSFMEVYGRTVMLNPSQGARGAHNQYLGTWVELGIVGLLLMLLASGCAIWTARKARGLGARAVVARAAQAATCGVLVAGFFGDFMWTKFFWMPFILLAWGLQEDPSSDPGIEVESPGTSP